MRPVSLNLYAIEFHDPATDTNYLTDESIGMTRAEAVAYLRWFRGHREIKRTGLTAKMRRYVLADDAGRASTAGGKRSNQLVQRLKATRRQDDGHFYSDGLTTGQRWAKNLAEACELQRLERLRDDAPAKWERQFETSGDADYSASECVAEEISPDSSPAEFWGPIIGENDECLTKSAFLLGFANGALAVWATAKKQVECETAGIAILKGSQRRRHTAQRRNVG